MDLPFDQSVLLRFYGLLATVVSLVGCAVGPDYRGTCAPVLPASYATPLQDTATRSTAASSCKAPCGPRLVLFSDPVLNALVARAEQQNLDMREAYQRIIEARAWVRLTRGDLFPTGDALAEYARTKRSRNARPFVGANGNPFDLFSLGFDSSWEIDLFGRLRRQVEVSEAELAAQHENFQDVRLTLLADVATSYVRVRVLQHQLRIAQKNIALQEETLELIDQLQKAGKATTLDTAQARSFNYVTMSEVSGLEQQLQRALNQLSILLGEAPGPSMRTFLGYGPIPTPPELAALGVPADLMRRRPDIRRAEQDVVAASARIGVAAADLYPQLTLLGTISVDSRKVSSLFTTGSLVFSAGPSFRWNILNFWRVFSNIQAYEAQYAQAVTRYRNVVLNAAREVEDGLSNYHWEQFRKIALEQTTLADAQSVELSLSRYRAGKASYQRVLDSQQQLLRDELRLAASRGALALELIRISRAVGGGWCAQVSAGSKGPESQKTVPENLRLPVPEKLPPEAAKEAPPKPKAPFSGGSDAKPTASFGLKQPGPGARDSDLPSPPMPESDVAPAAPLSAPKPQAQEAQPEKATTTDKDALWRLPSPLEIQTRRNAQPAKMSQVAVESVAASPRDFALQVHEAAYPASTQPWWRKLAIGFLSLMVVGLSLLLLAILAQRRAAASSPAD